MNPLVHIKHSLTFVVIISLSIGVLWGGDAGGAPGKPPVLSASQGSATPPLDSSKRLYCQVLFDFEKGIGAWYPYSHNAEMHIAHSESGGGKDGHSLEANFTAGKGSAFWLGLGFAQIMERMKDPWKQYAGGHLSVSVRSDCSCPLSIVLRTSDNVDFIFRLPKTEEKWSTYRIPFSSFIGEPGQLDLASKKVANISFAPAGRVSGHFWLDDITVSSAEVALPSQRYDVIVTVRSSDGAPLPDTRLAISRSGGRVCVGSGTSSLSGTCAMTISHALVDYIRDQADPGTVISDFATEITAEHDGLVPTFVPVILKPGINQVGVTVKPQASSLPPLHVDGNRLRDPAGKEVWLQGLSIDSMEWSPAGEHILKSVPVAIDLWNANVIRIPVVDKFWFGKGDPGRNIIQRDGGEAYRRLVDLVREQCKARGAYLLIDLHGFGGPVEKDADFWKDVAARYKNDPLVIFEIFNEPCGIPWDIWRNGGDMDRDKHDDKQVVQNEFMPKDRQCIGMQGLVRAIRSTGANNLIAAGCLGWSYDLSGILTGSALDDTAGGQGIMYVWHVYPWSHWQVGWQRSVLDAAEKFPIFVTEVGNIRSWDDFKFIKQGERVEDITTGDWPRDILGLIQSRRLNWTGFSFHVTCGPPMLLNWSYVPNDYWGVYVKRALAGEKFELKRIR